MSLRKELKRVTRNNINFNEVELFKSSLKYIHSKNYAESNPGLPYIKPEFLKENFEIFEDDKSRRLIKKQKSFTVKHFVNIERLVRWRNQSESNDGKFNSDYILSKFTNFDTKNKKFKTLIKKINQQEILINKGFLNKYSLNIQRCLPLSQSKNEFNKNYYDDEKKKVIWESKDLNQILHSKTPQTEFTKNYWKGSRISDALIIELLMRGNQEFEISYQEFEINITERGWEYLEEGWWKRNGKWLGTTVVSIIAIIISGIAIYLKFYF